MTLHIIKRSIGFVLGMIAVIGIALLAWGVYLHGHHIEAMRELEAQLEEVQKRETDKRMQDVAGGSTPQETLQIYIDALRAGDVGAAADLFVSHEKEEERLRLEAEDETNRKEYIKSLELALSEAGSYAIQENQFTIRSPIFLDFQKYPNGIWKIVSR